MSRSFFDLGQRLLRFQSQMLDFSPVYSGEQFSASWPSCLYCYLIMLNIKYDLQHKI